MAGCMSRGKQEVSRTAILLPMVIYHCMADLFILSGFTTALVMLNEQQFYLLGEFQTSQTGAQPYCNTSPYGEFSLVKDVQAITLKFE